MRLAVIDCGTNTFHILVADVLDSGEIVPVFKERRYVRLGQDGLRHIGPGPFQRGIDCLRYFKEKLLETGAERTCVFGTEALRRAQNGQDFIQKVAAATGIQIQLISGDQEARLIHLGVMQAVPPFEGKGLVMDVGGGSVEFIVASQQEVFWAQSFPIGVQVLFSKFHRSDPIPAAELQALETHIETTLQPLFEVLKKHRTPHLLGASGSFEVVEEMHFTERLNPLHSIVRVEDFYRIHQLILPSKLSERLAMERLPVERAELIVVAFALINLIVKRAGIQQIITSAYAMKEGMLLDMAKGD